MNQYTDISDSRVYLEMIRQYSESIEINPQDADSYFKRGNAYCQLNKYELAITDYSKAIEINPADTMSYYKRANAYARQKSYLLALSDYLRAKELDTI
jgi:tetratricopeptide (TPR) repeat protein